MFRLKRQPRHPLRGWVKILARCGGWITLYQTNDHELAYDLLWYLINRPCSRLREPARTGGTAHRRGQHKNWKNRKKRPAEI